MSGVASAFLAASINAILGTSCSDFLYSASSWRIVRLREAEFRSVILSPIAEQAVLGKQRKLLGMIRV
jgi:hypothetical protein